MKIHAEHCRYKLYQCPNQNCKELFYAHKKEAHLQICEFRLIECDKCKKKIIFNDTENHLKNDCPDVLIT